MGVAPATAQYDNSTNATEYNVSTDGELNLAMLDVGQGSAYVLWGENETLVYDTANRFDDGQQIIDFVENELNRSTIDFLVTSHTDSDHIGGAEGIINHFENNTAGGIGSVWRSNLSDTSATYQDYVGAIEANGIPDNNALRGDTIPFSGANISVLHPTSDLTSSSPNDDSVALYIENGAFELLLLGDNPVDTESQILDTHLDKLSSVDIVEVSHHGASGHVYQTAYQYYQPDLDLISAPIDSTYGHPDPNTVDKLEAVNTTTVWTATAGTTIIEYHDDRGEIDVVAQADPGDAGLSADSLRSVDRSSYLNQTAPQNLSKTIPIATIDVEEGSGTAIITVPEPGSDNFGTLALVGSAIAGAAIIILLRRD